jgi:4-aminobutyrate aminotransferase-like enzyme
MLALMVDSSEIANKIVLQAHEDGLILFWLLYEPKAVRISPPLTITKEEIEKGCQIILNILNSL